MNMYKLGDDYQHIRVETLREGIRAEEERLAEASRLTWALCAAAAAGANSEATHNTKGGVRR